MPQKMSKSENPTKEVIPMKKRIYRKMSVNDFQPQSISIPDLGGKARRFFVRRIFVFCEEVSL